MKVLVVKTSSLGDIVHTLPALTDARQAIPTIHFDWVVEESFAEIPSWHSAVNRVIPVAIRRWRRTILKTLWNREGLFFLRQLKAEKYDVIIDAQGLIKSAVITRMARGYRVGLGRSSLTEPLARFAYQKHLSVDLQAHAVSRMRRIFAEALNYPLPSSPPNYGVTRDQFQAGPDIQKPYGIFLHGTTWNSKRWPEAHWIELAKMLEKQGMLIYVPWSNKEEFALASRLSAASKAIQVLPRMSLLSVVKCLSHAAFVVSVDTGLAHLATALAIPLIALYGPTNPARIGVEGAQAEQITSCCDCLFCNKSHCKVQKNNHYSLCLEAILPKIVFQRIRCA